MRLNHLILYGLLLLICPLAGAQQKPLYVLGIAQDGGYPQIACERSCCAPAWKNSALKKFVVALALVDSTAKKWWLVEATPDIKDQLQYFRALTHGRYNYLPDGILITHAHMGHYTGLMQLGREALNTRALPVYVLPKMKHYLESNGPWSQLAQLRNIDLRELVPEQRHELSNGISVTAFTVPHRDEFSETAGFRITANERTYLFIPDIDKWEKWNKKITEEVRQVDIAFLDATFSGPDELPNRNIAEIPHPLASETIQLFEHEKSALRKKIYFIHFNHTNPLMWSSEGQKKVKEKGCGVALQGSRY